MARFYSYFAQGVQNPCKKRAFFYNNFAQRKTRANAYSTRFIKVFAVKILFNYIYKTIFKLTFSNLRCKKNVFKKIKNYQNFNFFCVFPSTINKVFCVQVLINMFVGSFQVKIISFLPVFCQQIFLGVFPRAMGI